MRVLRAVHDVALIGAAAILVLLAIGCDVLPPTAPTTPPPVIITPPTTARTVTATTVPPTASVRLEPYTGAALYAVPVSGVTVFQLPATATGGSRVVASAAGYTDAVQDIILPASGNLPVTLTLHKAVPGCDGRLLVDPQSYLWSVLGVRPGQSAATFVDDLLRSGIPGGPFPGQRSDASVHYGITQQRGGDGINGRVVGRLFLPTDVPDGNNYYTRPVNILFDALGEPPQSCGSDPSKCVWGWQEWGNPPYTAAAPPYAPRACP